MSRSYWHRETIHSVCKISGGPVQIIATLGAQVSPFSHTYAGVRIQHFSDAGLNGPSSLGVDMYIAELGYRF